MKIVEPARTNEEITSESHPPFFTQYAPQPNMAGIIPVNSNNELSDHESATDFHPSLLLLNIQALNNDKVNELTIDLFRFSNIKVVCLTETWSSYDSLQSVYFRGFYSGSQFLQDNFSRRRCCHMVKI